MKLVYLSLTGNVKKFVEMVGMDNKELSFVNHFELKEDYILIVPSYDDDITSIFSEFINYGNNLNYLIGFVGSGSRNFADEFCFNAKDLSLIYSKPLIYMFEFSGTEHDIIKFKEEVQKIGITRTTEED